MFWRCKLTLAIFLRNTRSLLSEIYLKFQHPFKVLRDIMYMYVKRKPAVQSWDRATVGMSDRGWVTGGWGRRS